MVEIRGNNIIFPTLSLESVGSSPYPQVEKGEEVVGPKKSHGKKPMVQDQVATTTKKRRVRKQVVYAEPIISSYDLLYCHACDLCDERFKEEKALKCHRKTHRPPRGRPRKVPYKILGMSYDDDDQSPPPKRQAMKIRTFPFNPPLDHYPNSNLPPSPPRPFPSHAFDLPTPNPMPFSSYPLPPPPPSANIMAMHVNQFSPMPKVSLGLGLRNDGLQQHMQVQQPLMRSPHTGSTDEEWIAFIQRLVVANAGRTTNRRSVHCLTDEDLKLRVGK